MGTNRLVTIAILLLLSGLGRVRGGSFVVSVSTALTRRRTTPSSTRAAGTTTTTSSARCRAGSTAGRGQLCSPSYCNVRREGQVRASASDINNQDDNSGLFTTTSSYVPSGLTIEEYQQIKANEAERLQNLNLGAWGPKFLRSNGAGGGRPPDGDWMVMPRLWTHGYDSNLNLDRSSSSSTATSTASKLRQVPRRAVQLMRQYGPAFVLAYVLVETIHSVIRLAVRRLIFGSMLVPSTLTGPKVVVAAAVPVLRAVIAAAATPRIRTTYLEDKSRGLLWSQRRLWSVTVVALAVVWALATRGMMGR